MRIIHINLNRLKEIVKYAERGKTTTIQMRTYKLNDINDDYIQVHILNKEEAKGK